MSRIHTGLYERWFDVCHASPAHVSTTSRSTTCAVELAKADFAGIDTVINLASRVHVMREDVADPLAEYRRVIVAGTLNLARAAVEQGVHRFIFVSSIEVNGDTTSGRKRLHR